MQVRAGFQKILGRGSAQLAAMMESSNGNNSTTDNTNNGSRLSILGFLGVYCRVALKGLIGVLEESGGGFGASGFSA